MEFALSVERWPLAHPFRISREAIEAVPLLVCTLRHGGAEGRGEAVGVDYRGETPERIAGALQTYLSGMAHPPRREEAMRDLPPGGARNALDCALWDLEAKTAGRRAWELASVAEPQPRFSACTISLASPAEMGRSATVAPSGAVLKLKLGGRDGRDLERVEAVRAAAPERTLIVDVNEGWSLGELNAFAPRLSDAGVALIEQPLPSSLDGELAGYCGGLPLCADESFDDTASFEPLSGAYDFINIKLDKCGGLTSAFACAAEAQRRELGIFIGCMLGTSLGMAPAFLLAQSASYVDLDGPLLLERDREPGIRFEGAQMHPFTAELWG